MLILKQLFGKQADCPRCLGKGNVNLEDIKRLGRELYWIPGTCAFCFGKGKATKKMIANVSPDLAYLSSDISKAERARIIRKDPGALARAKHHKNEVENFISEINYLYFTAQLNIDHITNLYLLRVADKITYQTDKVELIEYINRIINHGNRPT